MSGEDGELFIDGPPYTQDIVDEIAPLHTKKRKDSSEKNHKKEKRKHREKDRNGESGNHKKKKKRNKKQKVDSPKDLIHVSFAEVEMAGSDTDSKPLIVVDDIQDQSAPIDQDPPQRDDTVRSPEKSRSSGLAADIDRGRVRAYIVSNDGKMPGTQNKSRKVEDAKISKKSMTKVMRRAGIVKKYNCVYETFDELMKDFISVITYHAILFTASSTKGRRVVSPKDVVNSAQKFGFRYLG